MAPNTAVNGHRLAIGLAGGLLSLLITIALTWTGQVSTALEKVRDRSDAKIERLQTNVNSMAPDFASFKAQTQEQFRSLSVQLDMINQKLDRALDGRGRRR